MSSTITQQQLESYLWGAATILRGLVDAGDYKQYIFPLVFFVAAKWISRRGHGSTECHPPGAEGFLGRRTGRATEGGGHPRRH